MISVLLRGLVGAMLCGYLIAGSLFAQQRIDLGGPWKFKSSGDDAWLAAEVPGTVHTDLQAAGLIADPFIGDNALQCQWVEERDWYYKRTFKIESKFEAPESVDLVCEGLDTYAEIFLNGMRLGIADNMHRRWRFPCAEALLEGDNVLEIRFRSPMQQALPAYQAMPFRLNAGNDAAATKLSPYVRKAAYNFGWDFTPRLLTAGIWRPIYLEFHSSVRIASMYTHALVLQEAQLPMEAQLSLELSKAGQYQIETYLDQQSISTSQFDLPKGKIVLQLPFQIAEPQFWWPKGLGAAHCYQMTVVIKSGAEVLAEQSQQFGLRSIQLVMEPDSIGTSFYFQVNDFMPDGGRRLFVKGANFVPEDVFLPRGRARQQQLLESADAVGMNMLRIWGGGVYADDQLYDWCDAHGILVWQDLAFACMMYPLSGSFRENAALEVQDNIERIRQHPSLALWCGNNEINVAWHNWGWQEEGKWSTAFSDQLWADYQSFFERDVPQWIATLDSGRPYISSSPLSNWGKEENFRHKNMHYWGVWHGSDSLDGFSHYVPRFMSEYGFQSWPSPNSLRPYVKEEDWRMDSEVILHRQKSYKGNAPILRLLEGTYGKPKSFSAFCQLSQYLQRDAMTLAIQAQRIKSPWCMGTLYWQLNDCWPGPSWSTINYDGTWKPAHYALKRLYAPVLVDGRIAGDSIVVAIASEVLAQACNLRLRLKSVEGKVLGGYEAAIQLQPWGAEYLKIPLSAIAGQIDHKHQFLEIVVLHGREQLAQDIVYFVPPKDLALPDPAFNYELKETDGRFSLELQAKTLIKDFEIQVDGLVATFSDNFFDLVPGQPKRIDIQVTSPTNRANLAARLRFGNLGQWIAEPSKQVGK